MREEVKFKPIEYLKHIQNFRVNYDIRGINDDTKIFFDKDQFEQYRDKIKIEPVPEGLHLRMENNGIWLDSNSSVIAQWGGYDNCLAMYIDKNQLAEQIKERFFEHLTPKYAEKSELGFYECDGSFIKKSNFKLPDLKDIFLDKTLDE